MTAEAVAGAEVEARRRGLRSFAGLRQADERVLGQLTARARGIASTALVVQCFVNAVLALAAKSVALVKPSNLLHARPVEMKGVLYAGVTVAVFCVVGP